jgi:uncharacterized protein YkwD/acylphosphatase
VACANGDTPATLLSQLDAEAAVLCLVNEQRTAIGVPPLNLNLELRAAARQQGQDAATIKWWAGGGPKIHINPVTGSTPQSRIKGAGYCPSEATPPMNENGYDAFYQGGIAFQGVTTPNAAVTWWMNSPPHKSTLLDPVYRETGIAVVLGIAERGPEADLADGGAIFVQTFGGCATLESPVSLASLWHLWQTQPNGDWSGWEDLAFYRSLPEDVSGDPAAASAADKRIEIFRESVGHLWHLWQTAPNGDWSDWEDLSTYRVMAVNVMGRPGVAGAADGRIEIFIRGSDDHVWHLWQTTPNGDWSDWEDLSAYRPLPGGLLTVAGNPAAGSAADGRIEIFVRGSDDHVWHLWQTTPNGDWSDWEDLSVYRALRSAKILGDPAVHRAADARLEIFA